MRTLSGIIAAFTAVHGSNQAIVPKKVALGAGIATEAIRPSILPARSTRRQQNRHDGTHSPLLLILFFIFL